ncbi:RDD family protein [Edaphobacter aggregans]|uniref:RDD family protein n=1 Tax=Edaphobacter aggregans TaxID=570835 RepID=UPI00068B8E62|nr:RDD family protein [Edaphobacter aggregans]
MSAERKIHPLDEASTAAAVETTPLEPFVLKQQVAERLAAHRARRAGASPDAAAHTSASTPLARTSRIAAAVAERYAHSKSYRDFLAEEAERAVREAEAAARQAEAAAEIAQRNAQALAQVQYDLLAELDGYAADSPHPVETAPASVILRETHPSGGSTEEPPHLARIATVIPATAQLNLTPEPTFSPADLTVRLASEIRLPAPDPAARRARRTSAAHQPIEEPLTTSPTNPEETLSLDEEIAFRQAPVFEPVEPPVGIPANLIEFPRQLVASRRARPRLAEGPLREEAEQHHDPSQLRIFEVEAEQISSAPASDASAPEWTSILLDAHPRPLHAEPAAHGYYSTHAYPATPHVYAPEHQPAEYAPAASPDAAQHLYPTPETRHLYAVPFHVAPLELRLMSAAVDTLAVLAGFLVFSAVFVLAISHFVPEGLHMSLQTAALSGAGIIVLLGVLYHYVFFTFSDATPGMRYARIGLCTFSDNNPTRQAMRRRIFALMLSAAPFGLGLLWSFLDEDRLGWHDRISRMYQRSY